MTPSARSAAGPRAVGIRDVAAAAGVSVTTVSHVLNDVAYARVSAETRAKVKAAAAELGYGPNRVAQALRTQRSGVIGFISEDIATTPHAGRIILGADHVARRRGYHLMVMNVERLAEPESREKDIDALLERRVDGVLYATMFHHAVDLPEALHTVPTVLADANDSAGRVPGVVPDEYGGASAAVRHLVEAGHRRVGFITNVDDIPATRERLRAFRDVMAEAGVDPDTLPIAAEISWTAGGYQAARKVLGAPTADRPTALFCFNDRMAMGAYRAAQELGLRIPEDLSVVGFDNQELIAESLHPALTTVALPHYEMGVWAVERLLALMAGDEAAAEPGPATLECPLVVRESVAPPRG